jgi:hypothetical protein
MSGLDGADENALHKVLLAEGEDAHDRHIQHQEGQGRAVAHLDAPVGEAGDRDECKRHSHPPSESLHGFLIIVRREPIPRLLDTRQT